MRTSNSLSLYSEDPVCTYWCSLALAVLEFQVSCMVRQLPITLKGQRAIVDESHWSCGRNWFWSALGVWVPPRHASWRELKGEHFFARICNLQQRSGSNIINVTGLVSCVLTSNICLMDVNGQMSDNSALLHFSQKNCVGYPIIYCWFLPTAPVRVFNVSDTFQYFLWRIPWVHTRHRSCPTVASYSVIH